MEGGTTVGRDGLGSFFRVNRWLIISLVALGVAIYLSARYFSQIGLSRGSTAPTNVEEATIVVARTPLPAYSALSSTVLALEEVPVSDVPPGALTSLSAVAGKWTLEAVPQGEPLVGSAIFAPKSANILASRIRPGDMAVDLPLATTDVVDGLVEPGDTISLFATITESNGQQASEDFLNAVKVLAVNGDMAVPTTSTVGQGLTLILALPPSQVSKLLFMQQKGPIEAVLDAPNTTTIPPLPYTTNQWQHPIP